MPANCRRPPRHVTYPGRYLEFNAMTKYFYTDRTVPKKRLTRAEMEEINRRYRVIVRCESDLKWIDDKSGVVSGAGDLPPTAFVRGPKGFLERWQGRVPLPLPLEAHRAGITVLRSSESANRRIGNAPSPGRT